MSPTYGILGVGALGEAVTTGLVRDVVEPPEVVVSPRSAGRVASLVAAHPTVHAVTDNQSVVDAADVVLVCLRERDASLLETLSWRADQVVVSAAAGVTEAQLRAWVAPAAQVARAVPMIGVADRAWSTPVRPAVPAAMALFERTGGAIAVGSDEEYDAIFTGLGTVAPFFAYLATIEDFLVAHGMAAADARVVLADSFAMVGAQLGSDSTPDFDTMVRAHATPGGGNDRLVTLMRDAGVFDATRRALDDVFSHQTGGQHG